ncbi:MAG: FkbM family methyltransferase [Microthrixaceae bacterium]
MSSLRRRLAGNPMLKEVRTRIRILLVTHRWRPAWITLAPSGHVIHVDPAEPRGWGIVHGLGRGHQPALIALWCRCVDVLGPDVVVDVGANYGELTLAPRYRVASTVYAVEGNPRVADLLERSIAHHPDSGRIRLHRCLVSDVDGGNAVLHVDPQWSGSASIAPGAATASTVGIEVPVRTVDALLAGAGDDGAGEGLVRGRRLLMKIDAEGWEAHIMEGARDTLRNAGTRVLLVEFDPDHLRRAGTDADALFATLSTLGATWSVTHDGSIDEVHSAPVVTTDLLVVSDPEVASRIVGRPTNRRPMGGRPGSADDQSAVAGDHLAHGEGPGP